MDDVHLQGETGMRGADEHKREGGGRRIKHGWDMGESNFHGLHNDLVYHAAINDCAVRNTLNTPQPFAQ
jgi:hypothetical protein